MKCPKVDFGDPKLTGQKENEKLWPEFKL